MAEPPGALAAAQESDEKPGWNIRAIKLALRTLAPAMGLNDAELEWFWTKFSEFLKDSHVLIYGGKLQTGAEMPGLVELHKQFEEIQASLQRLEAAMKPGKAK